MSRIIFAFVIFMFSVSTHASIRPIFIPGKQAIIIMQSASPTGMDPEPRALYEALAAPESTANGGTGKVLKTDTKDFSLVCAKKLSIDNVVCTFTLKPSDRVKLDAANQIADATISGEEAFRLYELCAGPGKTTPFLFETKNGWVSIESTQDLFHFHFER